MALTFLQTYAISNNTARDLLSDVGRRISMSSGDDREVHFLFQRVSVVVQRFNSVMLHDSFVLKTSRTHGHSSLVYFFNFFNTFWNLVLRVLKNNNNDYNN